MKPKEQVKLCHAVDCNVRIPLNRLMCPRHWHIVPQEMRTDVWRTYQPGQENGVKPTQAYLDASAAAINFIAKLESKPEVPNTEELIKTLERILQKDAKKADDGTANKRISLNKE